MVFGVSFRAGAYMIIGGFLMAMLDQPLLYLLSFANHEDHYLIAGLEVLLSDVIGIIIVISGGIMIVGNALVRKQGVP